MLAPMLSTAELVEIPLFAKLGTKELEYLAGVLPDIHLAPGEYIAHEGEGRALIITVEGKLELTKKMDGVERFVAHRLPGTLFGEVPIVLNGVFMASLRAVEPSRVIWMEPKVFHTLAAAAPEVAAIVGAAAIERIGGLQGLAREAKRSELIVMGARSLASIQALRTFLHRNQVEFEWRASDGAAESLKPQVQLPDGTRLLDPSVQQLALRSACRSRRSAPRTTW
jgi:thioredoxin reductase (NADPH)